MRGIKVTVPLTLGPAHLTATDVPESEHDAWAAGTTYALGNRVIKANRVWESAQAGNVGHDPETSGDAYWLRVGPTNRWAAFDLMKPTPTTKATSFYYEFTPGKSISALHIIRALDTSAMRVRLTSALAGVVYDSGDEPAGMVLTEASYWNFFYGPRAYVNELHFYDLPQYDDVTIRIDFEGGANLSVAYILAGQVREFGLGAQLGLRVGSESFSSTPRDQWGVPDLKKRPKARRMSFVLMHERGEGDELADFLDSADITVALWNVSDRHRVTKVLGTLTNWELLFNYASHSETSIELLGMPDA